ncbi:hypothetical protein F5Y09DRAFT_171328 [Xylaria sp. FL1042]|nr:hypothetical protein F5Y09DRAFT_171328 [Xylaria sp. FL1042]
MCGCERVTFLCECRHKERRVQRCHIYQLREQRSCWAWCFPTCHTKVRRHRVRRLCRECDAFFYEKYGEDRCERYARLFLDYKESKGWAKIAVDPRTVPREVLLQQCQDLGDQTRGRGRARGQPFQVHQPMTMTPGTQPAIIPKGERPMSPPVTNDDCGYLGRAAGQPVQSESRQNTPFPYEFTPSPLPTDPALFTVGDDEDDNDNELVKKRRHVLNPSPKPKYTTTRLPQGLDAVVPELKHLSRQRPTGRACYDRATPELQQPLPKTHKVLKSKTRESDSHLVKKLTNLALDIDIPNIDWHEYDGKLVPGIMPPPKGKRRARTLSPPSASYPVEPRSYSSLDVAIAEKTVPDVLIPGNGLSKEADMQDGGSLRPHPTYFVVSHADPDSPTGSSARVRHSPSHENVTIPPPQRLGSVFIPSTATCPHHPNKHRKTTDDDDGSGGGGGDECTECRGAFFKERGLPSKPHVERDCQSARPAPRSPVLVSVDVPQHRYSCAVQSTCYCDDENDKGDKCPSCRERDAVAEALQTTWI